MSREMKPESSKRKHRGDQMDDKDEIDVNEIEVDNDDDDVNDDEDNDDDDDEYEELEVPQKGSLYDHLLQILDKLAGTKIGQTAMEKTDYVLKVIEDTAKWSLPYDDLRVQLRRPLPWVFFLMLIVWLRLFRIWLSIMLYVLCSQPFTAYNMVNFLQINRRHLRAIRLRGLRTMKNRQEMSNKFKNPTLLGKVRKFVSNTVSSSGHIHESPTKRVYEDDDREDGSKNKFRQATKRFRDDDNSDHNLTANEMLEKYGNLDSDNDSDYVPKENASDGHSIGSSCSSSAEGTKMGKAKISTQVTKETDKSETKDTEVQESSSTSQAMQESIKMKKETKDREVKESSSMHQEMKKDTNIPENKNTEVKQSSSASQAMMKFTGMKKDSSKSENKNTEVQESSYTSQVMKKSIMMKKDTTKSENKGAEVKQSSSASQAMQQSSGMKKDTSKSEYKDTEVKQSSPSSQAMQKFTGMKKDSSKSENRNTEVQESSSTSQVMQKSIGMKKDTAISEHKDTKVKESSSGSQEIQKSTGIKKDTSKSESKGTEVKESSSVSQPMQKSTGMKKDTSKSEYKDTEIKESSSASQAMPASTKYLPESDVQYNESELPATPTEVASPRIPPSSMTTARTHLTVPLEEEDKQKSTPGHESAASLEPSSATAVPLTPVNAKVEEKCYRTITTQTPLEIDWSITIKTEIIHTRHKPKLEKLNYSVQLTPASSTEDIFYSPIGSPQDFHSIFHPAPIVEGSTTKAQTTISSETESVDNSSNETLEAVNSGNQRRIFNSPNSRNRSNHPHHYVKNRNRNRR